ncbi:MAG TPA: GNAT family N-acetyltransferase [Acidimicrobiales bacterium]|nr:GNAT family N-acetyltransferase [Acidimicrobiales bacterium]
MSILLNEPGVDGLRHTVAALREWQFNGAPMQLHPGDLGWNWQFGAEAAAAAIRTWSRDGEILAIGFLDSPQLIRMAIAPEAQHDEALAQQMLVDMNDPDRNVLARGTAYIEVRFGELFRGLLFDDGWVDDEPWTPLERDLADPVDECGVRIEVVGPERAEVRASVQRAAFDESTFSPERWKAMTTGVPYAEAECLLAYDDHDIAVAVATVWSAGPDKPGLLEPVGVHREHRGRGYGTAITVAAAAALRSLGSSRATVCTKSSNVGAIATYESAGFRHLPQVRDLRRNAQYLFH